MEHTQDEVVSLTPPIPSGKPKKKRGGKRPKTAGRGTYIVVRVVSGTKMQKRRAERKGRNGSGVYKCRVSFSLEALL